MVHGHDNKLRESVARYVEKLGLSLTILDEKENSVPRDDIGLPSDCGGVLYIKYDESGGWKLKLAKELKTAGLPIDDTALL